MEESYTKTEFWNHAGLAGLVLGIVPIVYMLIEQLLMPDAAEKIGALPSSLIAFILWLAKFAGCIFLMSWFMKRFAARYDGLTHRDVNRFGTATALTSALVCSAFVLAWSKFIDPEMFSRAIETASQQYSSFMDANTMQMIEQMQGKMPVIAFFSNFIYCFLYGSVLSAILSRNIGQDIDPFRQDNQ